MKTALITGGTGFLGKALAVRLKTLGYQVRVVGRNIEKGIALQEYGIEFIPLDLTHRSQTIQVCAGQDIAFHCAALSAPWGSYQQFYQANVLGTQHIVEGCQRHDVKRFIHVSTPSLYFNFCDKVNIKEDSELPKQACNYYVQTKRMAESIVQKACQAGLSTVILRPRGLFGPGDTSLFPRLIRANAQGGVPLIESGSAIVDITYVENVVEALILASQASETVSGQVFNITNDEPRSLKSILDRLFELLDEPIQYRMLTYQKAYLLAWGLEMASRCLSLGYREPLLTQYSIGVLSKTQTLDISAAKKHLGYQPVVSLDQGLQRFAAWWKRKAV